MEKNEKTIAQKIEEWKAKYGEVFMYEVDGKKCYLHKPSRSVLSAAASTSKGDNIRYNEFVLKNCWIDGDEEIRKDDGLFIGISQQLTELIGIKEGELKKL